MWGKESNDHVSNPFANTKLQIKGLDNLNPFNKKKKKQKFSIKMVDKSKTKKTKKSSKKQSTKSSSKTKPKSKPKSTPKSKPKSTPKKSTPKYKSNNKIKHKTKTKSSINTQHTLQPHIAQQQHHNHKPKVPCPKPTPKTNQKHSNPSHNTYTNTTQYQQPIPSHTAQQNSYQSQQHQPPPQYQPQPQHSHIPQQPAKPPPKPKPKAKPPTYVSKKTKYNATKASNVRSKPTRKQRDTQSNSSSAKKAKYNSKPVRRQPKSVSAKRKVTKKTKTKRKKKVSDSENDSSDASETEEDKHKKKKQNRQNKQDSEFRSRLEADIIDEKPDISFRDVQGLASVKLALYETIILPSLRPELFTGLRAPTSGLLLFGPPGNGKTMIAKCVAAECDGTFFSISASSITSKFVGDAERIMRTLFNLAREKAPSIIFIDEIDSLLTARGGNNEAESSRRIKTEFLIQFDGCKKASDEAKRVLVIGATNLPNQLDEAVLRRFGKRILVPLPDEETRNGLIKLLMAKQKNNLSENDYKEVVVKSEGYSCSDLAQLCKDASMGPIRDLGARIIEIENLNDMPFVEMKHFNAALDNIKPSLPQSSLKYFEEWNDKFGSKIHLSMNALPENMKPYTKDELLNMNLEADKNDSNDDEEKSDSD